jgi:iron(III) transport system ATP-binding protein
MSAFVEVKNLTVVKNGSTILHDVSFVVNRGEFLSILGPSGVGKTTLLRCLAGFERPDSGSVAIDGDAVSSDSSWVEPSRRGVGIVPQDGALFTHMTVARNIGAGLADIASGPRANRVAELVSIMRLDGLENRLPAELSGGQQQRVAVARAIAPSPRVVLLDEPFAALDTELRTELRADVRELLRKESITAILVTHDQDEALSLSDSISVMRDGAIIQTGTPADIYARPADIDVALFLGDAVILPGRVSGGKVETELGALTPLNRVRDGDSGFAAVRPENFYLQPDPAGRAIVTGRQFFGHDVLVTVTTPERTITARASGPLAPEMGMKLTVWVRGPVNFYARPD